MKRTKCVICFNKLQSAYIHKNQPITYCPKPFTVDYEDQFCDLEYGSCESCGSVQLMTLIDQAILYEDPHNITYNTPTWAAHHQSFADFISKYLDTSLPVTEIGGSSGILASLLMPQGYTDYTIMDFCSADIPAGVKFIQGNCETHDFTGISATIMSHLFEHLYNPRDFINQLAKAAVRFVAISIPNMTHLLNVGSPAVVHAEHTYFLEKTDAEYMFNCHGYRLLGYSAFANHSHFMIFEWTGAAIPAVLPGAPSRAAAVLETFMSRDAHFSSVELAPNAFIVPAGIYGQIIYTHTRISGAVAGFLDNDPSKQGRRLYGTDCQIYAFDQLLKVSAPSIYIHGGPYTAEIMEQIRKISPDAKIFEL